MRLIQRRVIMEIIALSIFRVALKEMEKYAKKLAEVTASSEEVYLDLLGAEQEKPFTIQDFIHSLSNAIDTMYQSDEFLHIVECQEPSQLNKIYPAAYLCVENSLRSLNKFSSINRFLEMEGIDILAQQQTEPPGWLGDVQLDDEIEQIIETSLDMIFSSSYQNLLVIQKLPPEDRQQIDAVAEEFKGTSLRAHTNFFLCLGISHGILPTPNPDVLNEIVRQFSFSARLFRQESKRLLWSRTVEERQRRDRIKQIFESKKEHPNLSIQEREAVETRNDELHAMFAPLREEVNKAIDW